VNKKLSYRKQIARQQRAHSNNSKFLGQGKFLHRGGGEKSKHMGHRWWWPQPEA